ncbi:outer membrane immunogenic protein [Rhodoblastus acidophilus]|uniref:Outer membrane immunogenic protein n=1 Tax=Rhodoblastus acidophilus TaxID=1074 RepID=A0A212QPD5_RHOAC|nr:outer membrane protein [Rhodoblastus acidophilus]PPQ35065.1 porin family protein [Rhodoblastus acidophilus]RAI16830.1 porin family protein [Rhodoblastus acidophilus]SNB61229.1 outer membrane immunogenic protein [Rhodoblastus acidophilus]
MRNVLLSTVAVLALTGSAIAADLPSRKAAPAYIAPVPAFSWTGFYVGIEGGADFLSTKDAAGVKVDRTGGLLGGVVGYNYELGNRFVLGLEGDAGGVLGGDKNVTVNGITNKVDSTYFADVRGRVGYALFDRALVYAAGGVAFGDVKVAGFTDDRVGYTVGGGVDYAFTSNLIGRVEYRYTDLGKSRGPFPQSVTQDSNAVVVGLLYKFGAPEFGPVVAKY